MAIAPTSVCFVNGLLTVILEDWRIKGLKTLKCKVKWSYMYMYVV